ncbi:Na/Pi symporter [Martelella sp. FLE1502]
MTILGFLIQLMSGAMLLLFSVRFMRIGIERLWSAQIRQGLSDTSSIGGNLIKGAGLGFVMQGATVVMLMAAGLAGTGAIPLVSATVLALGADMGSALAVRFLQLPVSALGPFAVLMGATAYLRAKNPQFRNLGRVLLGLGLVFLSLSIIRNTVEPISAMEGTAALVGYLNKDVITAVIAGIVLTFVMHSSVAAVLTAIAFAAHAAFAPTAALGFVLGCNIGSALLPLWLLQGEAAGARAVAAVVAILRTGLAVVLVALLAILKNRIDAFVVLPADETMLAGHLVFNFALLFLAPGCARLCRVFERRSGVNASSSSLPPKATSDIRLALPALKRMLSDMLDIATAMLNEVTSNRSEVTTMQALETRMNAGLAAIRDVYAHYPGADAKAMTDMEQILDFAIRVERCGDVLSGKLHRLHLAQMQSGARFSDEGKEEIAGLVEAVRETILIAHDAAWTGDAATAERLVLQKQNVASLEAASRGRHLARLRSGNLASLASSDEHLETIAALKEVNSKFATIGYAVLERSGGLTKTRLKNTDQMPAS